MKAIYSLFSLQNIIMIFHVKPKNATFVPVPANATVPLLSLFYPYFITILSHVLTKFCPIKLAQQASAEESDVWQC